MAMVEGYKPAVLGAVPTLHGSLITVTLKGRPEARQGDLDAQIHERLNPLTTRHTIAWR